MNKLRVEQWKSEPADLFAIRAFVKALPHMDDDALRAASHYLAARGFAEVLKRANKAVADSNASAKEGT